MIDNKTYAVIRKLMPIPCVDIIIHQDRKVLLCLRNNEPVKDGWWLPGGRILKGEAIIQTAHRKAKEELDIDIIVEKQVGTYDFIEDGYHTVTTVYLAIPAGEIKIKLDSQHSDYTWANAKDLLASKIPIYPILWQEISDSKALIV